MHKNWKPGTISVQGAYEPKDFEPRILPIYQSTTYKFTTCDELAGLFDLKTEGHMYTRLSNPTNDYFEKKIAWMEGGVAAVSTSSGQAATMLAFMNLMKAGDNFLSVSAIYGGTHTLFTTTFKNMGIQVRFFSPEASKEEIMALADENTKAVFGETIANPSLHVLDFETLSEVAKALKIPFIVDNTFATPILCNPKKWGAHVVIHSTTKYIDGHATSVGGLVVDMGNFDWANGNFPEFTTPDESYHGVIYTKDFPQAPYGVKLRVQLLRNTGATSSPFNSFMMHVGAETLHLRMERHSENALALAKFLQNHKQVGWVKYPFLPGDSQYSKARRYLKGGSGVLSFGIIGGVEKAKSFIEALQLASLVVHVADVRTCVLHPASTTHRQLSEKDLIAAGVPSDLIRVSVGIEDIQDILDDFDQSLKK